MSLPAKLRLSHPKFGQAPLQGGVAVKGVEGRGVGGLVGREGGESYNPVLHRQVWVTHRKGR